MAFAVCDSSPCNKSQSARLVATRHIAPQRSYASLAFEGHALHTVVHDEVKSQWSPESSEDEKSPVCCKHVTYAIIVALLSCLAIAALAAIIVKALMPSISPSATREIQTPEQSPASLQPLALQEPVKTLQAVAWTTDVPTPSPLQFELCAPLRELRGRQLPRKLDIQGEWAEKCMTLPHPGLWQPPLGWEPKNWCWEFMIAQGFEQRNRENLHLKTENWWGVQAETAQLGRAPKPEEQEIEALQAFHLCDDASRGEWRDLRRDEPAREEAAQWFAKNVAVFVVNLPQNSARLERIKERLKALDIDFERIEGLYLAKSGGLLWAKTHGFVPMEFDFNLALKNLRWQYTQSASGFPEDAIDQIGIGTAGCTAAHLNAMRRAKVIAGQKPLALILEDDANLVDDFVIQLHALVTLEVPCDWQVVNLNLYMPYGRCISDHLLVVQPDGNQPAESCRHGGSWNFGTMLYRTSELDLIADKLEAVVWNMSRPMCLVHDMSLAALSDTLAYYAVPAQQYPGFASFFPDSPEALNREAVNKASSR